MEKEIIVVPAVDCLPQSVCEVPILYSSLIFRVDYIFAQSLRRKPTTIIIETEKKNNFWNMHKKTKKKTKETKLLRGFLRWISDIAKDVRLTDEMLWQRVNDTIYLRSYFFLLFFRFLVWIICAFFFLYMQTYGILYMHVQNIFNNPKRVINSVNSIFRIQVVTMQNNKGWPMQLL